MIYQNVQFLSEMIDWRTYREQLMHVTQSDTNDHVISYYKDSTNHNSYYYQKIADQWADRV